MSKPRRARIDWRGSPAWLVLFPNGIAFAVQDDIEEYVQGLPQVWHQWRQDEFESTAVGGRVIEWVDQ
jgi:hypothetical protein